MDGGCFIKKGRTWFYKWERDEKTGKENLNSHSLLTTGGALHLKSAIT